MVTKREEFCAAFMYEIKRDKITCEATWDIFILNRMDGKLMNGVKIVLEMLELVYA